MKMNVRLKSLITAGCLTVLYGIYYWGIPALVNLPNRVDMIEQLAKKQGYNIEITNPHLKMGLTPSVILNADEVKLLNDDNSTALELQKPFVKIAILPFALKKADIKNFTANSIYAQIFYDKTLKLGQYPINLEEKTAIKLQHARVKLDGYKIDLKDLTTGKDMLLDGQYLAVDSFNPDKELKFATIADFYAGEKSSKISADIETQLPINKISEDNLKVVGHIINLDLHDFTPYARVLTKDKIQNLSGILNATAQTVSDENNHKRINTLTEFNDLGIFTKNKDADIFCHDKLVVRSELAAHHNGIEIKSMDIKGNKISSEIKGSVDKLTTQYPYLDLNIKINDTQVKNIVPLLPGEENLVPEINLLELKKTPVDGILNGEINIKGKADFPDVTGKISAKDVYLVTPIPNAPKAVINLDFLGQKVDIDVHVPTTQTQYVDVKGPINLYKDRYADLVIKSTDNIDFATAQRVLNPLHDILTFQMGPVPVMKLYGHGNIDLHVKGTKKVPHGWGSFKFYDTTASFIDINNLVLKNGQGELTFNDENTHFITHKATLNGKPVKVEGTCTMQGVLDFKVNANNQNLGALLNVVKTSPMLADIQQMLSPVEFADGAANVYLNITGQVKDPRDIVFNKNIFSKGRIVLLSDKIKLKGLPLVQNNVSGIAEFDNTEVKLDLISLMNNSKIKILGKIKDNNGNLQISSDRFILSDGIGALPQLKIPFRQDFAKVHTSFNANYSGILNPIDFNRINMKGKIYPAAGNSISVNGGSFELHNSTFKLLPLSGMVKGSPYYLSANVANVFKQPKINGDFNIKNFNIKNLNDKDLTEFLPPQFAKQKNDFKDFEGVINLSSKIRNNNIRAFTRLNDISMVYAPSNIKLKISSGHLLLNNNTLNINKLNSQFGQMPVLIDGKINKVLSKTPELNVYINAKPTQEFFDQFFNDRAVYPIKLKGDIFLTSKITGTLDNLRAKSNLKLDEDSSLYYMGASVGDSQNPVNIAVDSTLTPLGITLHHMQYDKIISSQNNRPFVTPQLSVSGTITYLPDNNAAFRNFRIKTQSPTDAKIFNIIFRKPIMKQGVFTSDLILNGTTLDPKIRGTLDVTSIDIPFFDSTIKDINFDFKPDKINIKSRGVVLTNTINVEASAQNKLTPPYVMENVKIKLADLDVNKLMLTLRDMEAESLRTNSSNPSAQNLDVSQIIVKNADITANTISVRNINATNLVANMSLNEKMMLDINNFKFNIAEGSVNGSFKHNLLTHAAALNLNLDKANAQIMTEALFDVKGQIYGSMTGNANLICNGSSYEKCMQTLAGDGSFMVADGKMPKLGSLEYLLKAGNLIHGGLTGLSINSIIDFITPLKTGEFNSISGDIKIKNGIIDPINIYSDGNDLNIYITGSYNIVTSLADMKVFGSLSRNITSVFGKIKNASLNTLLNTIPGINSEEEPQAFRAEIEKIPGTKTNSISRLFNAEIYGDINGENYVKSFKWIK